LRTRIVFINILLVTFFFIGCNTIELTDGDQHVTEEMHETISNYIVENYAKSYSDCDQFFEVHRIYGTSEENGKITVYMHSYMGGFNKPTGTENQAGHSLPATITLKKDPSGYTVTDYKEPKDGSLYKSSLKKMFPPKYVESELKNSGRIEDLEAEMDQKVRRWLGE
jgi:hypothetical protein